MKKKYDKYYIVKDNVVYDSNNNVVDNEDINKILAKYKLSNKFNNIRLIAKNLKQADNGIVYIYTDSKNVDQYIYGVNYVNNRKIKILKIFLNINSKIKYIYNFINKELNKIKKYKDIDIQSLFALLLLIELNFYIRTGKRKFLDNNETTGLLTLKKKNFKILKDIITIEFKGKSNKFHKFIIDTSKTLLYNILKLLYENINNEEDFIFQDINGNILSEYKFYDMIKKKFNIRLKDIRTYGVNKILINELWKEANIINISIITNADIKKIICKIIESTANIIGHTPTISKKSYIANELFSLINIETLNKANELLSNEFYDYMINLIKTDIIKSS
jgi:DNA topoisomerase IB